MTAAELLGQSHPFTRASRRFEAACLRLLGGLTILAAIALFAQGPVRRLELAVGLTTCAILGILALSALSNQRRWALEVVMRGDEDLPLDELERVRHRLQDPRERARLASSLERCLRSAERWHQTAPYMRPVANVRLPCHSQMTFARSLASCGSTPSRACAAWRCANGYSRMA